MDKWNDIRTERIHHISCGKCKKKLSTKDTSHELNKREAGRYFEGKGWRYIQGKGWHCPECQLRLGQGERQKYDG